MTESQNSNQNLTRSEGLNAIEQEIARIQQKYPHMKDFEVLNKEEVSSPHSEVTRKQQENAAYQPQKTDFSKQLTSERSNSIRKQEKTLDD